MGRNTNIETIKRIYTKLLTVPYKKINYTFSIPILTALTLQKYGEV